MLTNEQTDALLKAARDLVGRPYEDGFKCVDFVRAVYSTAGLTLPPVEMNVRPEDMSAPPVGHVLYLRHKEHRGFGRFTHAAIILPERQCIHASYYFGKKVVITSLDEMLEIYDVVT